MMKTLRRNYALVVYATLVADTIILLNQSMSFKIFLLLALNVLAGIVFYKRPVRRLKNKVSESEKDAE